MNYFGFALSFFEQLLNFIKGIAPGIANLF